MFIEPTVGGCSPCFTGEDGAKNLGGVTVFPNPAHQQVNFNFEVTTASEVNLQLRDILVNKSLRQ